MPLFGKHKNQKSAPSLQAALLSETGAVAWEGDILDLPVKETVILEKSMEFFQDPTPCYIHRGAVLARLLGEISGILEKLEPGGSQTVESPEIQECLSWLDLPEKIYSIRREPS